MRLTHYLILLFTVLSLNSQLASAHAFPVKNTPGAGAELATPPTSVTIKFDDELEPVFSKLIVKDANDKQVSQGDGAVENTDPKVLTTQLSTIGPGEYHVYWSVVSRDGHHTQGDYTFSIESQGQN